MGMFSWITSDTKKSVLVDGSVPVKMLSPDGRVFEEENYEGYGVFGGKDYFSLVAELNGKKTREHGIDLLFKGENNNGSSEFAAGEYGIKLPKIISIHGEEDYNSHPHTESCPEQGFRDWDDVSTNCSWCGENEEYCTCDEDGEYL